MMSNQSLNSLLIIHSVKGLVPAAHGQMLLSVSTCVLSLSERGYSYAGLGLLYPLKLYVLYSHRQDCIFSLTHFTRRTTTLQPK